MYVSEMPDNKGKVGWVMNQESVIFHTKLADDVKLKQCVVVDSY